jgi:regulatory protein
VLDADLQGLLNKALFYLKFRSRSVSEMRQYLNKKIRTTHWSPAAVEKVIDYLSEVGLLNDKDFIRLFVEQRTANKPKGEYALRQELRRFGIDKNLIDEYFNTNPLDEEKLAEKALSSRWQRFKDLPPEKRFQKACQFLQRKGFSFEKAQSVIANFNKNE